MTRLTRAAPRIYFAGGRGARRRRRSVPARGSIAHIDLAATDIVAPAIVGGTKLNTSVVAILRGDHAAQEAQTEHAAEKAAVKSVMRPGMGRGGVATAKTPKPSVMAATESAIDCLTDARM